MTENEMPFHDGIENVKSNIINVEDDKAIMKIKIVAKDDNYKIKNFQLFNKTRNDVVVKTHGREISIKNCIGILTMSKIEGDKEGEYMESNYKGDYRKIDSGLALIDPSLGDEILYKITNGDVVTEDHNPRHKVRDPLGLEGNLTDQST